MWRITSAALLAALALAAPAAAAPELVKVGDFFAPVHVSAPPGDPRVFVVQQDGKVMVVGSETPFADVSDMVNDDGSERGLLSIAFHPQFASNGLFYLFLTAGAAGDLVVLEINGAGRRELVRIAHPTNANHNGGQLAFGPDGFLYMGTGDGGGSNDPAGNAQDDGSELGKLLRIDVATGQRQTWSKGLRNPWRFSFDRQTGDLVIADVGQGEFEEIDFAPASSNFGQGFNYGWDCYEGNVFRASQCPAEFSHARPAHVLDHDAGACAITGGFVVRDPSLPTLFGRYVYSDNCLHDIWSTAPGGSDERRELPLGSAKPTSFGEDALGQIYLASIPGYAHAPGSVYRIDDPAVADQPPPSGGGPAAAACGPALLPVRAQRPLRRGRGLLVRVRTATSCELRVAARLNERIRFRSSRLAAAAGDRRVRLKLSRRGKARLRKALRKRSRLVTVTLIAGSETASRRLRVRR
jgi:hypothetical protein